MLTEYIKSDIDIFFEESGLSIIYSGNRFKITCGILQSLSVSNILDRLSIYHIDEYKYDISKKKDIKYAKVSRRLGIETYTVANRVEFLVRLIKI